MPLNIAAAEFTPFLKYDAKSGRFKVKADGQDKPWVEISDFNLAVDMAHIRTGWIHYPSDGPPHKVWAASVTSDVGPRPGPEYKLGFEVAVYSTLKIPNTNTPMGLRTWSSNAFVTVSAINDMYAAYEENVSANPDKVPIYAFEGVQEVETQYGTTYKPIFTLQGWVARDRTPALDEYQQKQVQVLPPSKSHALPAPNGGRRQEPVSLGQVAQRIVPQTQRAIHSDLNDPLEDIPF